MQSASYTDQWGMGGRHDFKKVPGPLAVWKQTTQHLLLRLVNTEQEGDPRFRVGRNARVTQ